MYWTRFSFLPFLMFTSVESFSISLFYVRYEEDLLSNICHGFSVHSLWPRLLWQAVTLWLVNRTACSGQKETTWWEPCGQIQTECRESQSSEGHTADQRCLWWACKGAASVGTPWLLEEDMGRRSPLSEYICLSAHLSQTTETSTLSRIKCERYIFKKKCVHSFIEVRKLCLIRFSAYICITAIQQIYQHCGLHRYINAKFQRVY